MIESSSSSQINNRRILRNTVLLYIRMLVLMIITLFTSRIVLDALGTEDYGIYNVVGGVIALLSFVNNSMNIAAQRFYSFEIGKGDSAGLNKIFNVSLHAHLCIAFLFVIIAETVGLWFVKTYLVIPNTRFIAAMWVYQCVVVSSTLSVTQVPYSALIIAKEKMDVYAYFSIFDVVFKLLIVYIVYAHLYDNLIIFAILNMVLNIGMLFLYTRYVITKFEESKIIRYFNLNKLKELFNFSIWSMFGEIAWVFTLQGVNIILNIFYGPVVNAARGISYQVNSAVSRFIQGFQTAVNPQLIKSYAAGEYNEMLTLLYRSTRFSSYLLLVLSLPLVVEMDFVLGLWLKEVPKHTSLFCKLVLVGAFVDTLSNLLSQIPRACGKIKRYQFIVSMILLLNFPISYFILKQGYSPESTMVVYILISFSLLFVRLLLCKKMVRLTIIGFMRKVILPIIIVLISSIILPLLFRYSVSNEWFNSLISIIICVICVLISSIIFGMDNTERAHLTAFLKRCITRRNI